MPPRPVILHKAYPPLRRLLLTELRTLLPAPTSHLRYLRHLMDYNLLGGKGLRGGLLIETFQSLISAKQPRKPFHSPPGCPAAALSCAWAIEFLQASFLVADDIMDGGRLRRGKPCWYRLPDVGTPAAINDGLVLQGMMWRLLENGLHRHPRRGEIMAAFQKAFYATTLGQFLDVQVAKKGSRTGGSLPSFTLATYRRMVRLKTAYYTVWLPFVVALSLGETRVSSQTIQQLSLLIGEFFQIQDDFLDCFGVKEKTGKTGNDIPEGKCTWLAVRFLALAKANETDRNRFYAHYGRKRSHSVSCIRKLYEKYDMPRHYFVLQNRLNRKVHQILAQIRCKTFKDTVETFWRKLLSRSK